MTRHSHGGKHGNVTPQVEITSQFYPGYTVQCTAETEAKVNLPVHNEAVLPILWTVSGQQSMKMLFDIIFVCSQPTMKCYTTQLILVRAYCVSILYVAGVSS